MAKTNKTNETEEKISLEEALRMEIFISQALIDLLVSKGILTHEEVVSKIKELRKNNKLKLG